MPEPNDIHVQRKDRVLVDSNGKEYELIKGEPLLAGNKYYHGSNIYELVAIDGKEYLREVPADSQMAKWLTDGA